MRSPLPDSSNLEAGIVEDALPSRLSRVHDNVRDLLRRSVFGSVNSSPTISPARTRSICVLPSPETYSAPQHGTRPPSQPSPRDPLPLSPLGDVPGVLFPAWRQSCHLPVATPNHPDASPRAMSVFLQQKEMQRHKQRQQKSWKRSKSRRPKKSHSTLQWVICSILGFAVLGLLGTYIALATTSPEVSPILHVLFVLALLLTSIVFVHTLIRLCCLRERSDKKRIVRIEPAPRRRRHHGHHHREESTTTTAIGHYVPPTPIPVHGPDSELSTSDRGPEMSEVVDKGVHILNPPPAYGSTTSSVRADPDLLYWHVVPSPIEGGMPSPTYDEVVREDAVERDRR